MSEEPTALCATQDGVDGGDYRQAIERLTAENRRTASGAIERRLVELRHAGFAALPPAHRASPWPPALADPFPATTGVPEIGAARLTSAVLGGALLHHGSLLVRGLVDAGRAALLREDIDRAFAAYDATCAGTAGPEDTRWFTPFEPRYGSTFSAVERQWMRGNGGVLLADSPRALFDMTETWAAIGMGALLEGYLGEWPALSFKKCTLRRAPADVPTEWHQDGAFLGVDTRTVNVWLACSPCGVDAPGLDVVPRRLDGIVRTGTPDAKWDWSVGPEEAARIAGGQVARPVFAPGDALLFDQLTLHRTGVGPGMTRARYAIENWFFAPSTYPTDQIPILF